MASAEQLREEIRLLFCMALFFWLICGSTVQMCAWGCCFLMGEIMAVDYGNRDFLTGLANRQGMNELFEKLPEKAILHFMFLDMDGFKTINDVYGHGEGDRLLADVADILRRCCGEALPVRIGGDEFAVVYTGEWTREQLHGQAELILKEISKPENYTTLQIPVTVSIGLVLEERASSSLEEIMMKSDKAMYQAKHKGKNCYVEFSDVAEAFSKERFMESIQEEALAKGQFQVDFQPVMNIQTAKLYGTRAVVVWIMEDGRVLDSWDFIPVFERNGFIRRLDMYVLEQACIFLAGFRERFQIRGRISIRISRLLLLEQHFRNELLEVMGRHQVTPQELLLNVEENAFSRGSGDVIRMMNELKRLDYAVGIIGFGKDFSCLKYLQDLPLDEIEMDAAYLKEAMKTMGGRQILKILLEMGRELKITLAADGISEKSELIFLSGCGCYAASGTYFAGKMNTECYFTYVQDRLNQGNNWTVFPFLGNVKAMNGNIQGELAGNGVTFARGISDCWGALYFPGGEMGNNVLHLPAFLLTEGSYTIAMWVRPCDFFRWTSVFYARFDNGFASLVPFMREGESVFRVMELTVANGWNDTICRQARLNKWVFLTVTYDAFYEIVRYYIDGQKSGCLSDVPVMRGCRDVMIGGDDFQESFKGYVSGLLFCDKVRTEDEIKELYLSFGKEPGFTGEISRLW